MLNESEWVEDPRAPASVPDGFGGHNAQVQLACSDPVAHVPAENRPAGFPFDDEADNALVTAQHVDAYLAAAEPLADYAAAQAACSDPSCARQRVVDLGRRVFRRPLTSDEAAQYGDLAATDLATAVHALLVSPHFLYRSELGEQKGDHYELTE